MISLPAKEPVECPKCAGMPTIGFLQSSNAYFAYCSQCRWTGREINIEATVTAALDQWESKAQLEEAP